MNDSVDAREATLAELASIAQGADLPRVAREARALAERLTAGRFFVAFVGQFKRGKSTLLNAVVNEPVLPAGVTPVTSTVTILRYGEMPRAMVTFANGTAQCVPIADVPLYVAEEHNHENTRGVAAVEVFLPAPLLRPGLCLVDTPGIGSVFAGNTEATQALVPYIDAAVLVLGADPPISGDELQLALQVMRQAPTTLVVFNKADRFSSGELAQARAFTERLLCDRLGQPIGPVFEVSATERLTSGAPTRDWIEFHEALAGLVDGAATMLTQTFERHLRRMGSRIVDDLREREQALVRPLAESERRITLLRHSVADAEIMLREMGALLALEQRRLVAVFQAQQAEFLQRASETAFAYLDAFMAQDASARSRAQVFDRAAELARSAIEGWLLDLEPEAEVLYRHASARFTDLANQFLARLAETRDPAFADLPRSIEPEAGLRESRHYYATSLMHLTASEPLTRAMEVLMPRSRRLARLKRAAHAYTARLLHSNSTRVVFDLEQRVEVSRCKLETELRALLGYGTASAERALERARATQAQGQAAVSDELAAIAVLRGRVDRLVQ